MGQLLDSVLSGVAEVSTSILPEMEIGGEGSTMLTDVTEAIKDVAILASQFTNDEDKLRRIAQAYDAASTIGVIPTVVTEAGRQLDKSLATTPTLRRVKGSGSKDETGLNTDRGDQTNERKKRRRRRKGRRNVKRARN